MTARLLLLMVFCAVLPAACAPVLDVVDAAPGDGSFGESGPLDVGHAARTFRVRGDETLRADVFVPVDDDGVPLPGPFPPALIVQGGLVDAARYGWLGVHLASRGAVVIAPDHGLDLAFFGSGDGLDALDALHQASADAGDLLAGVVENRPALALGHSLGGVVAASQWLDGAGAISHLALLASFPNPADDVSTRTDGRVLSLIGSRDRVLDRGDAIERASTFAAPTTVVDVDGLTHAQWTDDPTEGDLARENGSPISTDDARRRALFLVDALLADLVGEPTGGAVLDDDTLWPATLTKAVAP